MGDARTFFVLMAIIAGIPLVLVAGVFIIIPAAIIMAAWAAIKYMNRPKPVATIDLHAQTQIVVFPEKKDFGDHFTNRLHDEWPGDWPVYPIFYRMSYAADELYEQENVLQMPLLTTFENPVAEGRYRDRLLAYQKKAENPGKTLDLIRASIFESYSVLHRNLPACAKTDDLHNLAEYQPPRIGVPLRDLLPNPNKVVNDFIWPFYAGPVKELGLFIELRKQINANQAAVSEKSRTMVMPADYEGDAIEGYLNGTPLIDFFYSNVAFELGDQRFSGHWIVAPPGRGKTTLLHSLLVEDLKRDAAIIVMDSKGDLIERIQNLKELEDRYIIINPSNPIAINPLDIAATDTVHTVDLLEYLFGSLMEFKLTTLQSTLFRSVLRALILAFPNPTLDTLRDVIQNGLAKHPDALAKLPPELHDFFEKEFNTPLYQPRRQEVLQRIRYLLENDAMRTMLTAPKTRFNIGEGMNAGKVTIINNSRAILGDTGSEFFSRFFLAQILAAGIARSQQKTEKKPCYVYIDEAHTVIHRDEKLTDILDTLRSQRIAIILAHQRVSQITSPNVLNALANCAIRYANSDDDARLLAPRLRTTPEFLQSLKIGEFGAYVRDMTPKAIRLTVTPVDFDSMPKLTAEEQSTLTARIRQQYGIPVDDLPPEADEAAQRIADRLGARVSADGPTEIAAQPGTAEPTGKVAVEEPPPKAKKPRRKRKTEWN